MRLPRELARHVAECANSSECGICAACVDYELKGRLFKMAFRYMLATVWTLGGLWLLWRIWQWLTA